MKEDKEFAPQGDIYGISSAMKSMVRMYQCSSRRTGRTSHLISLLQPGDMVVFADSKHMENFRHQLRMIGKADQVNLRVVDVKRHRQSLDMVTAAITINRLHFDHQWIEMFYQQKIDNAAVEVSNLQKNLSKGVGINPPQPMQPKRFSVCD